MNSLGRKVLIASLGMLVFLSCLGALLVIELEHWHDATRFVMRDYRRSLLDGELQEALTRAMAEKASYALTGHEHFQIESREAIERAQKVIRESRELLAEQPLSPGDATHAGFLQRQERLVDATEKALDEADLTAKVPGGGASVVVPLQGVYATEVEADDLRRETMEHHRAERADNELELRMHGHRALVLVSITAVACLVWTVFLIAFVRRRIVSPIVSLSGLTEKVAEGDLGQRSPITHRDEIGRLQRSFNQMVVELSLIHI